MCRAYWTLCGLSLAFGCLVGLVIANRLLLAADGLYGPARSTREEERRQALTNETNWLLRDSVRHPVIEYVADGRTSVN